jgi:hypothetical protein
MFSLLAFFASALGVNKYAWNVPPHQLLTFTVGSSFLSFVKIYPKCQFFFIGITRFHSWLSSFGGNERHDSFENNRSLVILRFGAWPGLVFDKDAWNVPPHQLLVFFFCFVFRYPICQFSFTGITRFRIWRSPFVGNERLDF